MTPALRATRCHEGQPMGRNRGVKKRDRESGKRIGSETIRLSLDHSPLIGLVGFEPTASSSRTRRSTKLSHSPRCAAAPAAAWEITSPI